MLCTLHFTVIHACTRMPPELLYAYVNDTPAKNLVFPSPYALPKSVIESMTKRLAPESIPQTNRCASISSRFLFQNMALVRTPA